MVSFYGRVGVNKQFDDEGKLVTSPVFSPTVFAILRLLFGLYCLVSLIFSLIWDSVVDKKGERFFSFFTNLSFTGVTAYYCMAGVHSWGYARKGKGWLYPLQTWPRPLQFLHVLLQSTIITFPILVTLVFWVLLASSSAFATPDKSWSNLTFHAMNSGFALFEIFFSNSAPAPWLTLAFNELILAAYVGLSYVTFATQGFYTYPFLDPQKQGPLLAAYIAGIAAGQAVIFCAIRGLVALRQRLAHRWDSDLKRKTFVSLEVEEWRSKPVMSRV